VPCEAHGDESAVQCEAGGGESAVQKMGKR